ncbi:MAG: NTP transferase domain-containing protein [bacterium]|nr:NTP transferase domain-containing protein [bacterium]
MANIIPMAGEGSRFVEAGYILPKALVPVSGKPMILRVIETLPKSDKSIFLVRQEHVDKYQVDKLIKKYCDGAIVVPVSKTTEGQACTCMLAVPYLEPEEDMFIAACDNSFVYDQEMFNRLKSDPSIDSIIWTFTKNELLTERPRAWGWVKLDEDLMTINDISVKVPVSNNSFNDHAVVATFYFKKASEFKIAYDLMVKENYRVNNEFYVDSIPVFYKKLGMKSVIFDVDLYVGWGKPSDLYKYQEKEYFSKYFIGKPVVDELWHDFFSRIIFF